MRNRFLVALVFTVPTVLWSDAGANVLGEELPTPFGLEHDLFLLLLSLPIVLYASSIFFTGALRALRARTLDMMVLVAVAIGTAVDGIRMSVSVYSSLPFLACVALLFFYEINKPMESRIERELGERRAPANAAP